jgi:WD repeat-containing protein 61
MYVFGAVRARIHDIRGSNGEPGPFGVDNNRRWFEEDTFVARLGLIRNVTGVVVTIVVSLMTAGIYSSAFDPFERATDLVYGLLTSSVAVLATMALLVLMTKSASRGAVTRRMWTPLRTMLLFPVLFAAPFVVGFIGYWLCKWLFDALRDADHAILAYLGTALLILVIAGMVLTLAWTVLVVSVQSLVNLFRSAEGHPLLAPIATTAIVWVLPQLLRLMRHADPPTDTFGIAVFYGGAVTVTLLSAIEIVRAARVPGIDLRGGPPATPLPRGPGSFSGGFPGLTVLASLVGAVAATSAFAAVALAAIPGPSGAPVLQGFYRPDGSGDVKSTLLSPDGSVLAVSTDTGRTLLFNTGTGKLTDTLRTPVDNPTGVAFSPDGKLLAESGYDFGDDKGSPVYVWELATHKLVATLAIPPAPPQKPGTSSIRAHYVSHLTFNTDGSRLVGRLTHSSTVLAWDTATWVAVTGFTVPGQRYKDGSGLYQVRYLPDNATIMAETNDGLHFLNTADGKARQMPGALGKFTSIVASVAVSADGSSLAAITGGPPATITVWDLRDGTVRHTVHIPLETKRDWIASIALNDTGSRLAVSDRHGNVHIADVATGHRLATLRTFSGWMFGDATINVEVQPVRGKPVLLTISHDKTIVLWNLATLPGADPWNQAGK